MKFELLHDLSESRSFRGERDIDKVSENDIGDLFYAHLLALFIMNSDDNTKKFAKDYAYKTALHGNFDKFVTTANDFYVLAYANNKNKYFKPNRLLNVLTNLRFGYGMNEYIVLNEFQNYLQLRDAQLKNSKRAVAYWDKMPSYDKLLALRCIRQIIKSKMPLSDIVAELDKVSV